ncbi:DUF4241 domain-containing protein [Actinomadura sp. DC4]|uniref:DUF4241 domain-containing protein n=1 Tax=Actinomadura sp. DC4 TaxID=3055069 RepID=UPI0025AFD646|nr:DUF4241 domain-containing protein [Actinomadura sp. DC4]MDN3352823.1 DUF4241 domain-containing protein [Actinomadura sp. DC4]
MPMPAPDFERLFVPGTRHTLWGDTAVTIRLRTGTELSLPSGRVVAGEPFMFAGMEDSSGFVQRVPPGRYPLVLVLGVFGEGTEGEHSTIAAARLVIRDEPVDSWELAVYEGQDPSGLGDDEFFGYPVDGGTGGFVDVQNIAPLCADHDVYLDRLMEALDVRAEDYVAPVVLTDDASEPIVVAFSSGGGDGFYPTWVGRTAGGEVACLLTDFFLLPGEDEDEDDEPDAPAPSFGLGDFAQGHEMRVGQALRRQSLTSPSGRYVFVHQDDGNLVLYDNARLEARWATGTCASNARLCTLREKEGLVLFDGGGRQVWASGVSGGFAARLIVRDDGDVVVEDFAGTAVWSSGTAEAAAPDGPPAIGDRMLPGQTLGRQSLTSPSGRYTFVHQDDGNLVLYDNQGGHAAWSSGTQGLDTARCVLHLDGDLALYDREARAVWSTDTGRHPDSVLSVGDDGVALRATDGTVLWSAPAAPAGGRPWKEPLGQPLSALRPAVPAVPAVPAKPTRPVSAAVPGSPLRPAVPTRPAVPSRPARPAVQKRPVDEAE